MKDERKYCMWIYDEYYEFYDTDCGESFCSEDGQLDDQSRIKYCPFCGKEIRCGIPKKAEKG